MYFERPIHWCTQNHLCASSSIHQEYPPWIRKMTRSTFVNFSATEKCYISIGMYYARQIQFCDQNGLWTPSLESGRSSMDQEGFLNNDQIYFCHFFSYREVWCIHLYVLCKTNIMMWSKLLMDIILGVKNILHGSVRVLKGWPDLLL